MDIHLKDLLIGVVALCAAYIIFVALFTIYRISIASALSAKAVPFSLSGSGTGPRILVVGDSTGVGTGSASPELSVPGRLAAHLSASLLINRAKNGAKVGEVTAQFVDLPHERFDLVLIQAGGNDIIRFTGGVQLRADTQALLRKAHEHGEHVVFMSTGDVGTASIFLPPLGLLYDRRTRAAREIFIETAREENVIYVDLFKEPKDEPFSKDPKRFYAADGFHPSEEGYAIWFEQLKAKLPSL